MSNSLLSRENVVPFPFGQTLPEESDGPKWQQDWGLIGSNPGVRILSMDLLFLIFLLYQLRITEIPQTETFVS